MDWTFCAFKFFFGLDCPGCGLIRSLIALLRGNVAQSIAFHPMGIVVMLGALIWRWRQGLGLSEKSQKILAHAFLVGFFVPWVVKIFL